MMRLRPQNSQPSLKLAMPADYSAVSSTTTSSAVTGSTKSSPASSLFRRSRGKDSTRVYGVASSAPSSPELTSLPQFPTTPPEEGRKHRVLPSLRSRKSSTSMRYEERPTIRHVADERRRAYEKAESPVDPVPATEFFDLPALNAERWTIQEGRLNPSDLPSTFAPRKPQQAGRKPPRPLNFDKEMPPLPVHNRSESNLAARPTRTIPNSASTRTLASPRDGAGLSFFGRMKATSSRASDGIRKAAAMMHVKRTDRSGSGSGGRPMYEEHYEPKVLHLPLVEQVRLTRPHKVMHELSDKTVFWLPALPHRALEFLKRRGCQEEGLYRVNGAVADVRHWYQRFDREVDIDLLTQDIPDINSIGSLLKQWLRELPNELLPKAVQDRIKEAHPDATEVPQLMMDELSQLPPWNYHLLRAITGHLSQLIRAEQTTRMNFEAVRTCMPGLKIESYCLRFLLTKWGHCWKGCNTEQALYQSEVEEMKRRGWLTGAQIAAGRPLPELDQVQPLSPIRADFK